MALALIGMVLFSTGGCILVGGKNPGAGATVLVIGLVLGLVGIVQHPGSGCDADGRCETTNHYTQYTP